MTTVTPGSALVIFHLNGNSIPILARPQTLGPEEQHAAVTDESGGVDKAGPQSPAGPAAVAHGNLRAAGGGRPHSCLRVPVQ